MAVQNNQGMFAVTGTGTTFSPAWISTPQNGDLAILVVLSTNRDTTDVPTVSATTGTWEQVATYLGGSAAAIGVGTGPRRVTIFKSLYATGDSNPVVTVAGNATGRFTYVNGYTFKSNTDSLPVWGVDVVTAQDATADTTASLTFSSKVAVRTGDVILAGIAGPNPSSSSGIASAESFTSSGSTFATVQEAVDTGWTTNDKIYTTIWRAACTSGAASAETLSMAGTLGVSMELAAIAIRITDQPDAIGGFRFGSPNYITTDVESGSLPAGWTTGGTGTKNIVARSDAGAGTTKAIEITGLADSAEGWVEYTVSNPSSLRYEVSTEDTFDFFRVMVDGVEVFKDSGTGAGFQTYNFNTSPGSHTIRLRFTKDSGSIGGSDTVWISTTSSEGPAATGEAPPVLPNEGTATGSFDFSGTGTGATTPLGSITGAYDFTGTPSGTRASEGISAAGSFDFTGTATGSAPNRGAATGSFTFTGASQVGSAQLEGSSSGAFDFAGSSVGATPAWKPKNLVATPVSGSQIDLTWDALGYSTGYDIERDGVIVATDVATNSYSDTGLSADTLYTYRVRAVQA